MAAVNVFMSVDLSCSFNMRNFHYFPTQQNKSNDCFSFILIIIHLYFKVEIHTTVGYFIKIKSTMTKYLVIVSET